MSVIIRRERRQPRRGRISLLAGGLAVTAAIGVVGALAWQRGAPRPVHEIVINVPVAGALDQRSARPERLAQ